MAWQQFPEFTVKAEAVAPVSMSAPVAHATPERLACMARNLSQLRADLVGRLRSRLTKHDFNNCNALLGAVETALRIVQDEQRLL